MADPSRAPVMSGSVADKVSNAKSAKVNGDVVEAPKVNFFSSLTGLFMPSERLNFFRNLHLYSVTVSYLCL